MEKKELSGRDQWLVLKRLLAYLGPHKRMLAFALFLLVLTVLGEVLGPLLIQTFIDDYLTPRSFPADAIAWLAGTYIFILLASTVIGYYQFLKFQELALKIIQQLRIDVFTKVHALGMSFFDKTPDGSVVSRVTNDTEAIKEMFVSVLIGFVQSFFLVIGVYIAMFFLNARLALAMLLLLPVLVLLVYLYRKYSSIFYQELREQLGRLNAKLSESIQGMGMVQSFAQEDRLQDEFSDINDKHWKAGRRNIKIDGLLLHPAIDLVYAVALVMLLSYFGWTSFSGAVEVGVLYAFVAYINRFFEPINQVMERLSIFQQAVIAAHRVFELLDEQELAPRQGSGAAQIQDGKIEFRNVSFSYDGKTEVLKNISFTAEPGETVALVGHTGSGKSSIINLLMRFYEFEQGDILIDGLSVKEYPVEELREKMGLVLQDPFLFYGTIESNIRLHHDGMTGEAVRQAAAFVQAAPFIESLPDGYSQAVTERGSTFSSGQRQLIAFARTIAADPKILVLDEATANIDTETETAIQTSLDKMKRGRTTIAIAHRLSTIQDAGQILVLHQGEIIERGTHQELLEKQGLYHKMYLLQNGIVPAHQERMS